MKRFLIYAAFLFLGCTIGTLLFYVLPVSVDGRWKTLEQIAKENEASKRKIEQSIKIDAPSSESEGQSSSAVPGLESSVVVPSAQVASGSPAGSSAASPDSASASSTADEEQLPLEKRPMIKMLCKDTGFCNEMEHKSGRFLFTICGARTDEEALALYSVNEEQEFFPKELRLRVAFLVLARYDEARLQKDMARLKTAAGKELLLLNGFYVPYRRLRFVLILLSCLASLIVAKLVIDFSPSLLDLYTRHRNANFAQLSTPARTGIMIGQLLVMLYSASTLSLEFMPPVWSFPLICIWCYYLIGKACSWLSTLALERRSSIAEKGCFKRYATVFLCLFFAYWFFINRGMFVLDSVNPYIQYVNGEGFGDWHPVVHTLFNLGLLCLVKDFTFVVLVQLLLFALGMAYVCSSLRHNGFSRRVVTVVALATLWNPFLWTVLSYPWKDAVFLVTGIFILGNLVGVFCSKGAWLKHKAKLVSFILLLSYLSLVRHNGIFYTWILLVVLLCAFNFKKQVLVVFVSCFLVWFVVKVPFYKWCIHVRERKTVEYRMESMGLPMNVLGGYMKLSPENLPETMRKKMLEIAPEGVWQKMTLGNFNALKQEHVLQVYDFFDNVGYKDIMLAVRDAYYKKTRTACGSLGLLTQAAGALCPSSSPQGWIRSSSEQKQLKDMLHLSGREEEVANLLRHTGGYYRVANIMSLLWTHSLLFRLLCSCGFPMLAMLVVCLSTLQRHGLKNLLLVLPCLALTVGTALLLTGPEARFFYLMNMMAPTFIALMLSEDMTCPSLTLNSTPKEETNHE